MPSRARSLRRHPTKNVSGSKSKKKRSSGSPSSTRRITGSPSSRASAQGTRRLRRKKRSFKRYRSAAGPSNQELVANLKGLSQEISSYVSAGATTEDAGARRIAVSTNQIQAFSDASDIEELLYQAHIFKEYVENAVRIRPRSLNDGHLGKFSTFKKNLTQLRLNIEQGGEALPPFFTRGFSTNKVSSTNAMVNGTRRTTYDGQLNFQP